MAPFSKEEDGGVLLSIIASISYDHMQILGDTLAEIAHEKAGIVKPGIPVILYPEEKEAEEAIEKVCSERGSTLIKVPCDCVEPEDQEKVNNNSKEYVQKIRVHTKKRRLPY